MDTVSILIRDAHDGGWKFWRHWRQMRNVILQLASATKTSEFEQDLAHANAMLRESEDALKAVKKELVSAQVLNAELRAGNKKLAEWIATTHRVDLKSTLGMKLFSAAKKTTVLFVLCAGMDAAAQAPPIIRNPVTTNSFTNGVINWVLTWFAPTVIGWSPMTGGSIPPSLTVITSGVSMGPPTTNVEVNGTSDIVVSGSVVANTNRLAFGLSTTTSNRVQMALTNITSANSAFTSLINSSNPAVLKTISAAPTSVLSITDNGTNLVLASSGGGSSFTGTNHSLTFTFDGGGQPLATNLFIWFGVTNAMTINSWQIVGFPTNSSIVVNVLKDTFATFPGGATSIAGTELPTLLNQTRNSDGALGTWTTTVNPGDWFEARILNATNVQYAVISVYGF